MIRFAKVKFLCAAIATIAFAHAPAAMACAACYGKSDSPLAKGMNAGIFALLGVVGVVLSGFATFGIYLVKKSASVPVIEPPDALPEAVTQKA